MVRGLKQYTEKKDKYIVSLQKRGLDQHLIEKIDELGKERSEIIPQLEVKRRELNEANPKGIPDDQTRQKLREISDQIKQLELRNTQVETELEELILKLPNLVSDSSPEGGESNFIELKKWGNIPSIQKPKDHEQLSRDLDLIDFGAGTKVSGSKFYFLKNEAVWLEFALIQFVLNLLRSEGFTPMITPQIVRNEVLEGIGFTPKGPEKQVYGLDDNDMSLIGTAEITLGGYHKDEVIDCVKLPLKYAGFSTCFRTEAGAYGRHSAGLYRVHQFDKVEMFILCLPKDSESMHTYLLSLEERIFQELGIPYRVIDIATGDLGAPAFKKYDIEAWMPGRGDYGEVTSTSNTTDFQAIRLNIKYDINGQKEYLHTLNGTAVAISRALIAIMENYQQDDGTIKVPDALIPYTGFTQIQR